MKHVDTFVASTLGLLPQQRSVETSTITATGSQPMKGPPMKLLSLTILLSTLLTFPSSAAPRRSSHSSAPKVSKSRSVGSHTRGKCASCARDSKGRIVRSRAAKASFRKQNPCPSTRRTVGPCPGYIIDHVEALRRGGEDTPRNMQWQSVEEAREKDRTE